eukprot:m.62577 g.62577  ORF g.62577 m.62577 type:complete len:133 (-) comp11519_c0_seq2:88-486(-)
MEKYLQHDVYLRLISQGIEEQRALCVLQMYLDLTLVKKWTQTRVEVCDAIRVPFITGRNEKDDFEQVVVPMLISDSTNVAALQELMENLPLPRVGSSGSNSELKKLILGILDSDSTCVYYAFYNSLHFIVKS